MLVKPAVEGLGVWRIQLQEMLKLGAGPRFVPKLVITNDQELPSFQMEWIEFQRRLGLIGCFPPFLAEDVELSGPVEQRVRANVQKLVSFTTAVEKKCGISGRVLWSESEENLAQKLISRLQQTH